MESNGWHCLYKGVVDAVNLNNCVFRDEINGVETCIAVKIKDHHQALEFSLKKILEQKILKSLKEIKAIGHRVVHGGEKYRVATVVTPNVQAEIERLCALAPLHNPPNLSGLIACKKLLPHAKQIAVFDTAFHQTMPEKAYLYALPLECYTKHHIRRYGFHGTSHKYISAETLKLLKQSSNKTTKSRSKIITCHLGNGSSLAAIVNGKSIDTSMGFTPLEGVPMGSRSGDIDPAIVLHLIEQHKMQPAEIAKMLNKQSGLLGLTGISTDVRTLRANQKNPKVARAFQILCYKIAKYIGSYAAAMNGFDAITFTGGIGQNAWYMRSEICHYLTHLGLQLDPTKNKKNATEITRAKSKIRVFVIPTNEEKQIAIETLALIKRIKTQAPKKN